MRYIIHQDNVVIHNNWLYVAGVLKLCVEMLQLLAGGTLAMQAAVLAASLFQKSSPKSKNLQPSRIPNQVNRRRLPSVSVGKTQAEDKATALSNPVVTDIQMFRFKDPQVRPQFLNFWIFLYSTVYCTLILYDYYWYWSWQGGCHRFQVVKVEREYMFPFYETKENGETL